jgi:hypothetical protein
MKQTLPHCGLKVDRSPKVVKKHPDQAWTCRRKRNTIDYTFSNVANGEMTGRRVTLTSCKLKLIFSAYTDQAIDQGYRAVRKLLIELTPKICRDCQQ